MKKITMILFITCLLITGCNMPDNSHSTLGNETGQVTETTGSNSDTKIAQNSEERNKSTLASNTEITQATTSNSNVNQHSDSKIKNIESNKINPIDDNDLQISKFKLNMTLDEFEKVMPDDLKERKEFYDDVLEIQKIIYKFKDGTKIVFSDNALSSITTINSKYGTHRGLKVGDFTTKLLELYGEPKLISQKVCWEYKYMSEDYTVLYVTVKNEKVIKIEFSLGD